MKKRIWIAFFAAILLVTGTLCGCGSADKMAADMEMGVSSNTAGSAADGYYEAPEMTDDAFVEEEMAYEEEGYAEKESVEVENNSKIIRRVSLYIETLYFEEMIELLNQRAGQYGGYVESSDVTNKGYYGNGRRYGYFTVRIPAAEADAYMEALGDKGVIASKSENLEDVTLQYVDTQSHIEMLKVERERLMELLEQAVNLEEILMIEERLTGIRYELESYESQLKVLDNKINYTTINIDVSEVEQITTPKKATLGEKIVDTFKDSVRGIVNGLEWLLIFILGKIPYIVIFGVVLAVIVVLMKRKRKNKKAAREIKEIKE